MSLNPHSFTSSVSFLWLKHAQSNMFQCPQRPQIVQMALLAKALSSHSAIWCLGRDLAIWRKPVGFSHANPLLGEVCQRNWCTDVHPDITHTHIYIYLHIYICIYICIYYYIINYIYIYYIPLAATQSNTSRMSQCSSNDEPNEYITCIINLVSEQLPTNTPPSRPKSQLNLHDSGLQGVLGYEMQKFEGLKPWSTCMSCLRIW